MTPQFRYDPEADSAYIVLGRGRVAREDVLDDARVVDYDAKGRAVAVELLHLTQLPVDLRGLPRADEIAELLHRFHVRTVAA